MLVIETNENVWCRVVTLSLISQEQDTLHFRIHYLFRIANIAPRRSCCTGNRTNRYEVREPQEEVNERRILLPAELDVHLPQTSKYFYCVYISTYFCLFAAKIFKKKSCANFPLKSNRPTLLITINFYSHSQW